MPYVRFWINDTQATVLLELAMLQERDAARLENRKPKKIRLSTAVGDCFSEGLEDLQVRASDFRDGDSDDET